MCLWPCLKKSHAINEWGEGSPSSRIHEDTAAMPGGSSVPRDECSSKVQAWASFEFQEYSRILCARNHLQWQLLLRVPQGGGMLEMGTLTFILFSLTSFFFLIFKIGMWLLHNIAFVSAVQCESASRLYTYIPSFLSFSPTTPTPGPLCHHST